MGHGSADDAAVYRIGGGQVLVQTVDFFTPVVDDPYLFGQIAAANALSDVYAMRARPVLALALAAFPTTVLPTEVLDQILRGGSDKVTEAGAVIGGGHSIDHDVPIYGLSVTGPRRGALTQSGALPETPRPDEPLGSLTVSAGRVHSLAAEGVSGFFASPPDRGGAREGAGDGALIAGASRPGGFDVHSATDVTGYACWATRTR